MEIKLYPRVRNFKTHQTIIATDLLLMAEQPLLHDLIIDYYMLTVICQKNSCFVLLAIESIP